MRPAEHPQRLRLAAAPGSNLESVLSAARLRGPSDAQLRALEASLAISLGAAVTGAVVSATVSAAAPAVSTAPVGASALWSAGAFKVAALVALTATAGGLAVYRYARPASPVEMSAAPVVRRPESSLPPGLPSALPALPESAPAPAVTAPLAGEEHLANTPHPRRPGAASDELALITRAQRTLASDPTAALAVIEANRRALAQSAFAQEAEVIAVAALARLGRMDDARERAARFVARFPDSVHARRMRRVAAIIK